MIFRRLLSSFPGVRGPLQRVFARFRIWLPIIAGGGLLLSVTEGLGIGLLIPMLQILSNSPGSAEAGGPVGWLNRIPEGLPEAYRLPILAALMVLLIVLRGAISTGTAALVSFVEGKLAHDIRMAMANRLLTVAYPFFLMMGQAKVINALGTDSWRAANYFRDYCRLLVALAAVAIFSTLLVLASWRLAIVAGAALVLVRLVHMAVKRAIEALGDRTVPANIALSDRMIHLTYLAKVVRLFRQQGRESARFQEASHRVRSLMLKTAIASSGYSQLVEVLYAVVLVGIIPIGAYLGTELPITIAFLLIMYRMQPHLQAAGAAAIDLAAVRASIREIEVLLTAGELADSNASRRLPQFNRGVSFRDVSYRYPGDDGRAGIQHVSFDLPTGSWIGLAGASGGGKSTMVNLLCGLLQPTSGTICVDDVSMSDLDMQAWRGLLSVAGQDLDVFEGTIAENIAYGRPDASKADIIEAATIAGVGHFVAGLPREYETRIGDRGLSLSGGQRQRIGLARAILMLPRLLILDEATNALEVGLEEEIVENIKSALPNTTVLLISHRPSVLRHCHSIVELSEGIATTRISAVAHAI